MIKPLGIGFPYISELPPNLYRSGLMNFVEVTPETICRQRSAGDHVALDIVPAQLDRARETCADLPAVVHGVELSIGSAQGWNSGYLEMLDVFQREWPFLWHSEHLGFQTIEDEDGTTVEVGVPLPVPATGEAADLIAERVALIRQRYGVPFLLENPAYYIADLPSDPEIGDDIGLLHAITKRSDCGILLDLHNIHCNTVNHGLDAFAIIDKMPLNKVFEIHIAGGASHDGFWMDGHNGAVAEPVWDLLEYTLQRAPNVSGVVFEMLAKFAEGFGVDAISGELERAGAMWARHKTPIAYAAA